MTSAEQRNYALDALSEAIARVEHAIANRNLRVHAAVPFDAHDEQQHELVYMLSNEGWGVFVTSGPATSEVADHGRVVLGRMSDRADAKLRIVRATRAPRLLRMAAAERLPALWEQILANTEAERGRALDLAARTDALAAKIAEEDTVSPGLDDAGDRP